MEKKTIINTLRIVYKFLKQNNVRKFLTYLFFVLSIASCIATYLVFTNIELYSKGSRKVISILYCDIAFILTLLLLYSNKLATFWTTRHKKGSRLTLRLITLFSLISVVPSILMTLFSAFFFHNGIDSWFNERNKIVLKKSLNVAELYLEEHKRHTLNDCITMAKTVEYNINQVLNTISFNEISLRNNLSFFLDDICGLKNVSSAMIVDANLNIIAYSKYSVSLHFLNINLNDIRQIKNREAIILQINEKDKNIIAIANFENLLNEPLYLIIEKKVDSNILSQANDTRNAYNEYENLISNRNSLEIAFIFMFLIVGFLLLITSIAVAIIYSWRIVQPISNLVDVSENIIAGNMEARAIEVSSYEEVSVLVRTFNQMINQVHQQREDLIKINKQLDERIKFSTSVLTGVSSGVIGIDNNAVYIWNNAAEKLLGKTITFGEHICNLIPEIEPLLLKSLKENIFLEQEIHYNKNNDSRVFSVKIENIESPTSYYSRYVITFDDMTNIIAAQRKAAWSEVARRVAHEIKNPLTPIQLAAERIRKKYMPQIAIDCDIFNSLINVIIRQVYDIKRLIDDFTFFARLPEPSMKQCDICEICNQAVFLMQNAVTDIKITFEKKESCNIKADERLLHQSIVNLIQNAINALKTIHKDNKQIIVSVKNDIKKVFISIEDNGPGLPKEKIESLATPYFTLMPQGTGLGLAIVKKIIQDHGGELIFGDSSYGGAKITVILNHNT